MNRKIGAFIRIALLIAGWVLVNFGVVKANMFAFIFGLWLVSMVPLMNSLHLLVEGVHLLVMTAGVLAIDKKLEDLGKVAEKTEEVKA